MTCECTICKECGGSGEICHHERPHPHTGDTEVWLSCEYCKGSGKIKDDCMLHCPDPGDLPNAAYDSNDFVDQAGNR